MSLDKPIRSDNPFPAVSRWISAFAASREFNERRDDPDKFSRGGGSPTKGRRRMQVWRRRGGGELTAGPINNNERTVSGLRGNYRF